MKALVVYFSYSGNTKFIAEAVAKVLGADTEELKLTKPLSPSDAGKYEKLLKDSDVPLLPLEHDAGAYDVVVIGTPAWYYTFAPPVRRFLESVDLSGKRLGLFCCHGGGPGKTLQNLKNALPNSTVAGTIEFYDPALHNANGNRQKAEEWARSLLQ